MSRHGKRRTGTARVTRHAVNTHVMGSLRVVTGHLGTSSAKFWPNHYMALYHAGAARFALGDHAPAHRYLVSFLEYYDSDDGWRRNALSMIAEIEAR